MNLTDHLKIFPGLIVSYQNNGDFTNRFRGPVFHIRSYGKAIKSRPGRNRTTRLYRSTKPAHIVAWLNRHRKQHYFCVTLDPEWKVPLAVYEDIWPHLENVRVYYDEEIVKDDLKSVTS